MSASPSATPRRRSTVIRLAVAGIAVLGIGAAITTAAWTDQAWFTAEADTASVELYGALADDGTCPAAGDAAYVEADDAASAVTITLDPAAFADLIPGDSRSVGICLWNGSDVDLSTSLAAIDVTGDAVFAGATPATIGVSDGGAAFATTTIAADAVHPLDVVVETPEDWGDEYQGVQSGTVEIVFTGSTDLP